MMDVLEGGRARWADLTLGFLERAIGPWGRPTAVLYLLLAVALFGGAGLWLTFVRVWLDQATSCELAFGITTYAFAIIMTSIGDLFLDRDASRELKYLLFGAAFISLIVCGALTYVWVFTTDEGDPASPGVILVCLPIWATWWLANGLDQRFLPLPGPRAALGGDPDQPLS